MNALFTGIYNKFKSDTGHAFYTGLGGRFYFVKAPQSVAFPFAVADLVAGGHDWNFDARFEDTLIQIAIFSKIRLEAGTLLAGCKSRFDHCELTVSGWNFLYMQPDNVFMLNETDQDPTIYGYRIEYNVMLEN